MHQPPARSSGYHRSLVQADVVLACRLRDADKMDACLSGTPIVPDGVAFVYGKLGPVKCLVIISGSRSREGSGELSSTLIS